MNGNTFDRMARHLGTDASRRQMLGGLIGAAAAMLTGGAALEAKPNNKGRRRNNGNNGQGAGTEKVQICHFTNGRKRVKVITVARPAVKAHLAHGDTLFVDCCFDRQCDDRECFTTIGCVAGECTYEVDEGASCDDFAPAAGVCNAEGECEELPPTGGG